ncbi:MAG: hypothetical protein CMM07_20175 [Rhodopirellula sp.]|nr:hypothetical protein [Rhodopirellula sp.]
MSSPQPQQIEEDIKTVVWNASTQIQATDQRSAMIAKVPVAFGLLLVVPTGGLLLQAVRFLSGLQAGSIFPLWLWVGLTAAVPVAWLLYQAATLQMSVDRKRALLAADKQIGAVERLTTADEFMRRPIADGFMQAAVDDASEWAKRGTVARLDRAKTGKPESRAAWFAIPGSVMLIALVFFLSQFTRPVKVGDAGISGQAPVLQEIAGVIDVDTEEQTENPSEETEDEIQKERLSNPRKQQAANRQGDANAAIPDNAEESDGKLNEGETRESQQSSNPSSAKGAPSASGQPSKSDETQTPRKKKKKKSKPEREREKKEREEDEKPSGASAGQGSSKGSDNNAAPSDWASTSQAATPENENVEEEDDVDDEEEEQESRGGVQPNMRDRRTPVNRDLQIGFGNPRPNPDANGRGGPSGQKKSRGVASLVLGVPIPDRVNGQPNKGRIRITQQRITPEIEESDPVDAQDRTTLKGPVGPIHHPELEPWLQNLVRRYFLDQREKAPLRTPGRDSDTTNSDDSLQTSNVSESDSPQS